MKKVFSEVSQNSQENTCARVSFLIWWLLVVFLGIIFKLRFRYLLFHDGGPCHIETSPFVEQIKGLVSI